MMNPADLYNNNKSTTLTTKSCQTTIKHITTTLTECVKTSTTVLANVESCLKLFGGDNSPAWTRPHDNTTLAAFQQQSALSQQQQYNVMHPITTIQLLENQFEHLSDTFYALTNNIKTNLEQLATSYTTITEFIKSITPMSLVTLPQLYELLPMLIGLQQALQVVQSVLSAELYNFESFHAQVLHHGDISKHNTSGSTGKTTNGADDGVVSNPLGVIQDLLSTHSTAVMEIDDTMQIMNSFAQTIL